MFNVNSLVDALVDGLTAAWEELAESYPEEVFYGFGIFTSGVGGYVMATAMGEQGLRQAALDSCSGTDESELERQMISLRYSPCDSPYHEMEEEFEEAQELLDSGPVDPYEDTPEAEAYRDTVFETYFEALRQLDEGQGLFGTGEERARLVLNVWMEDASQETLIEGARRLNPRKVVKRFERELAHGLDASPRRRRS